MKVTVDTSELRAHAQRMRSKRLAVVPRTQLAVKKSAEDIAMIARMLAPVGPTERDYAGNTTQLGGTLRGSIHVLTSSDGMSAIIDPAAPYARFVEFGTSGPYQIEGRHPKDFLWWEGTGHPVGSVMHPSTKAQPFMRPAAEAVMPFFLAALRRIQRTSV